MYCRDHDSGNERLACLVPGLTVQQDWGYEQESEEQHSQSTHITIFKKFESVVIQSSFTKFL